MKKIFLTSIVSFFSVFIIFSSITTYATENSAKTDVDISLDQGTEEIVNNVNDKTKYETTPAEYIKSLPQTGELIASFIYLTIGLSLLFFVLIIIFNRYAYANDWRFY